MKSIIAMASMLLFVLAIQGFGFAVGAEPTTANDSINITQMNETLKNANLTNGTQGNGTLGNVILINDTLGNASSAQNESDPFANARNRKPSSR